jgi:hypothetical protein
MNTSHSENEWKSGTLGLRNQEIIAVMKDCRISLLFCMVIVLCMQGVAQQATNNSLPTDGRVDGAVYRNSYFRFNYFIPEQWTARGTPGKMLGSKNTYLLLTLKKKSGDALSTVTVTAAQLSQNNDDDGLLRYLDERYRLHQEAVLSDTTINGIHAGKSKPADREPDLVVIGDRQFYRVQIETTDVTRVAMATMEKGYALVFELIAPKRLAPDAITVFMDSMHGLSFAAPVNVVKK